MANKNPRRKRWITRGMLCALVACLASSNSFAAKAQTRTAQSPQTKKEALPWPAQDLWTNAYASKRDKLVIGRARTYYLQSALPPALSSPPTWLGQMLKKASATSADLRIFLRPVASTQSNVEFDSYGRIIVGNDVPVTDFQILVTNRSGKKLYGWEYSKEVDLWDQLHGLIKGSQKRWNKWKRKHEARSR